MNSHDVPEYAGATAAAFEARTDESGENSADVSSLERLVASIHRQARAPRGFRFVANIAAADRERALLALRYGADAGTILLEPSAVDEAGSPVEDLALYVRYSAPEPRAFWLLFHALGDRDAA